VLDLPAEQVVRRLERLQPARPSERGHLRGSATFHAHSLPRRWSDRVVAKLDGMTRSCLIVDDSTRFLGVARRVLEGDDVPIVGVATSIAEALDLAARLRPEVVLVDIDLADESGFDLARRLREQPGAADMQLILISSHDPDDFAELIAASPVVGFLAKSELSGRAIVELL
jgi:CheY-like chemotaxis protein